MDFTLSPEIEDYRLRIRAFVAEHILPLEDDTNNFDVHDMIEIDVLERLRAKAKEAGLWAFQMPKERGGPAQSRRVRVAGVRHFDVWQLGL